MNAFRIVGPRSMDRVDISDPEPGPIDVVVRSKMLGLCGSDLKTFRGENPLAAYPLIPGHEIAGEIEHVGERVPGDYLRGMRVTVGMIVGLMASGHEKEEILKLYPYLEPADIDEALAYAAWRVEEIDVPLLPTPA